MSINALIIISCIVFVFSLLLYLLIKNWNKFKAFILKVDDKLIKRNESYNNRNKEKSSNQKEKEKNKEESNDVKQITYNDNKSKQSDSKQKSTNNNNSSKSKSNEKENSTKLKPSKAVEQIRPILLPPNKEAEERDIKLLEMKKRPEQIESSPQKAIDFKYGSRQSMQNQSNNQNTQTANQNQKRKVKNSNDDFISFNVNKENNFNPLKRDVKKQFDDIKNFLDLPENQEAIKQKGVSYNGNSFNTVDKVDDSFFKNPENGFTNYGRGNIPTGAKSNSSIVNNYNNSKNNFNNITNNNINTTHLVNNQQPFVNYAGGEVMQTNTKYARKSSNQFGMPAFNLSENELSYASKMNENNDSLTLEQENIDLNKLPNNLKKMIIQNILDRKDYD